MFPASHVLRASGWSALAGVGLAAFGLCLGARWTFTLHPPQRVGGAGGARGAAPAWPASEADLQIDWSVMRATPPAPVESGFNAAGRFRLAGTFLELLGEDGSVRLAVIDDFTAGEQKIVTEGSEVGGFAVSRIFSDHVILTGPNGDIELWMSFSGKGAGAGSGSGASEGSEGAAGTTSGSDRFGGRQIGEHRWVFGRKPLMDYYQELMDEPQRLVKVFDSLRPLYTEEGLITGYQLGVEGEQEFFSAVGLKQNDIVRSVNHLQMSNRRRAEFLIKQFVENNASAFVMDIERDGREQRLIYEIRDNL